MYETPRIERFGSLGKLTLFKPDPGFDLATPNDPTDCTEPAAGGGNPTDAAEGCIIDGRS